MGLKFSALDKLISLMKSADYYLDSKISGETEARLNADSELAETISSEDAKLQQQITNNKAAVDQLVVDNLTSSDPSKALSANQGRVLNNSKVNISDIKDNLISTDTNKPLSANQGRVLNNTFGNYYNKSEVDQLVIDTQSIFYGDGADSLTVPINADQLEGHPASYFIGVDSNLQDSIATEHTARIEAINTLTARMNTFTSLPEGSTTGDAELTDIRVGANGITYGSAGDAVRSQVSELKSDLGNLRFSITENNLLHIERKG